MLSRTTRPDSASQGRRSYSDARFFADGAGVIHIRAPHVGLFVMLHCERDNPRGQGEVTAVPTRLNAFPTCVRCLGMEYDDADR